MKNKMIDNLMQGFGMAGLMFALAIYLGFVFCLIFPKGANWRVVNLYGWVSGISLFISYTLYKILKYKERREDK